jgi:peroxiredoxin
VGTRGGALAVAAVVALGAAMVFFADPGPGRYVDAGVEAPGFELPRLGDAAPVSLADLRGRVVLLNFWATWCKPCEDELPSMQRLHRALAGAGFELLAISVDDAPEPVAEFRSRYGLAFPILLDPRREVAGAYQTHHFPESFLIDAEGRVVERYIGPRDWDAPEYLARIRALLPVLR